MKRNVMMALILLLAASPVTLFAQQTQQAPQKPNVWFYAEPGAQAATPSWTRVEPNVRMVVNGTEFMFDGKAVKGAPYSAEAVTETVQTLADGNRIVHSSSTKTYRDSEGRTRREVGSGAQALPVVTMSTMAASGTTLVSVKPEVFISDPVAGVNYSLDTDAKTARKMPLPWVRLLPATVTTDKQTLDTTIIGANTDAHNWTAFSGSGEKMVLKSYSSENETGESLGTQMIEGVQAEGKKVTTTIPAGKIGNELPIVITNETWYSSKLQTMVLSKRHDPRFGDTTFKLTNISQAEPPASLFQVPSDYTVVDTKTLVERKMKVLQPSQKYY